MTLYEFLLFLHVVAAIIWLGAGFVLAVLMFGAQLAGDREKEAGHHSDVDWLAERLFIPASMATLVFGLLLIAEGPWSFDQLWITLGLVGWLASFGIGILYFKPEAERIDKLAAEHGPDHPELRRRISRVNAVDRFELTILFLVVADMTLKPTGDDVGVLIAGVAILAAVSLLAFRSAQRDVRATGAEPA